MPRGSGVGRAFYYIFRRTGSYSPVRGLSNCFFFQAEDGIRDIGVTGVQTCALPILAAGGGGAVGSGFVATQDGYVITNDHVVEGGSGPATVSFSDGSTAQATIVGHEIGRASCRERV